MCLAIAACAGCRHETGITVTGRIADAGTGSPLGGAVVARVGSDTASTCAGRDGYYALAGLRAGDTLRVLADGYHVALLAVPDTAATAMRRDLYLDPTPDTAYTASGPVDASIYLDNAGLYRKKLSINEARLLLAEKFPGMRVYNGSLVSVNDREEWLFDMTYGKASASVYIDAHSGVVRSIESDDPNLDRKLQSEVGR